MVTFLTYTLNPGTVYKRKSNENIKYCRSCSYGYPYNPKLSHCNLCGVCFINEDHHCDVFGKCIAKNNVVCFYSFLFGVIIVFFGSMGSFIYVLANVYGY